MDFNIKKFKQELKNQLYEITADIKFLKNELEINDESLIKNNLPYLREGLFLFVETKVTEKAMFFKHMFNLIKDGSLVVEKRFKTELVRARGHAVPLNNFDEKAFANILVKEFQSMESLLEEHHLAINPSANLLQESFFNGVKSDEKGILGVLIERNLNNKEFIDNLTILPSFNSKKHGSFGDYYAVSDEQLISDLMMESKIDYLDFVNKNSLRYENSKIKKIFSCDENRRAFFITGAILLLNNEKINKLHIIQNYKKEDIIFKNIYREGAARVHFDSDLIKKTHFEKRGVKKENIFKVAERFKENGIYLNSLVKELDNYLLNIDFKSNKNKKMNFSLLELYLVSNYILSISEKKLEFSDKSSGYDRVYLHENYTKIVDNYLSSIKDYSKLNDEIIGMNRWGVFNLLYLDKRTTDIIDIVKKYNLNIRDLSLSKFNEPLSMSLERAINQVTTINNIDIVDNQWIKHENNKIIIDVKGLEKSFLITYNVKNLVKKNISTYVEEKEGRSEYKNKLEINTVYLDKYSPRDILLYLLKVRNDFSDEINFHSYMLEKTILKNIATIDKESITVGHKKAKI